MRNLSLKTTEQVLLDIFNRNSDNDVQKLKIMRDFAFIHLSSREKAEKAMRIINRKTTLSLHYLWTYIFYFPQTLKSMEEMSKSLGLNQSSTRNLSSRKHLQLNPLLSQCRRHHHLQITGQLWFSLLTWATDSFRRQPFPGLSRLNFNRFCCHCVQCCIIICQLNFQSKQNETLYH